MILTRNQNSFYVEVDIRRKENLSDAKERISVRDNFERDYGRIIHSAAFRRLQAKTQVIGAAEGDFHRTRLTHSLEVSQIARGIATTLNDKENILSESDNKIDTSLIEAAALAHDIGHPPFGHQGERVLNKKMQEFNLGFEGNAHTFRLLTNLEGEKNKGLDLTRATLLSILKYPAEFGSLVNPKVTNKPPKSSIFSEDTAAFSWILSAFNEEERNFLTQVSDLEESSHRKTLVKTLECSIIELADDIAYGTHDLQDTLKLKLINFELVMNVLLAHKGSVSERVVQVIEKVEGIPKLSDNKSKIKNLFADLISAFITDVHVNKRNELASNRLKYVAELSEGNLVLLKALNKLVKDNVIMTQRVQTIEWRGGLIVDKLFDAMINEKMLLPEDDRQRWSSSNDQVNARIVCDYIAGMTDSFALKIYSRLYESTGGRLFDI